MNKKAETKLSLDTEVQFLRGVGPRRAVVFGQLGVHTVGDLLEYYPRDYEFRPPLCLMNEMNVDHQVTIAGQVQTTRYIARSRPPRFTLTLEDATGECRLIWFHGGYLRDKFTPGDFIAAWGKVSRYKETLQIVNPRWMKLDTIDELFEQQDTGNAVYPACADLSSGEIARIIRSALDEMLQQVAEPFPDEFRRQRQLPLLRDALAWIHRPESAEHASQARRRLAYDELFLMELGIGLRRARIQKWQPAYTLPLDERIDGRIRRLFPFPLTPDQDKVVDEICKDMARAEPMNRLLQGDVGSGKTVVALYAALLAVGHHRQAAIMTPTEILAEQHFQSIEQYLKHSRVKRLLLKGGLTGQKRSEVTDQIAQGQIDIVVGTQALLQSDVTFKNLALVVVDEQHKFGVRQRKIIRSKDIAPHYLVMTATPIPRTLAMTVFGDLDVSTIEHPPPGRQPVDTRWIAPDKLPQAYEFIRSRVKQGDQAYFVYPRVQEEAAISENEPDDVLSPFGQIKAAVAEHQKLQQEVFPELNVGLIHGQLDRQTKQQTMEEFRAGRLHILVATVVIEVGVDVPDATIMVIEHADRFGLAQLHQLRGRIGRGSRQSYCLLFGRAATEQAQQRLEIMTQTTDGFRIAEEDLRLRGPGQFFGTAQHGLPELKIADLINDFDLLRMASRDAFNLADQDPELKNPDHQILRQTLQIKFGPNLTLIDAG
ncbi:MAG: ATP-dependent DNA helicase RecG [Sedimentisphaerales bacterium]|nr:ATP-dependent DNA helicase RecG [Sedimentisphaerales bacterium]